MKIGVLIIGSLYWDKSEHRQKWRGERLDLDAQQYVKAPIRYGRRSGSRGCSYTMVFSAGLGAEQFGHAIVIPCKSQDLVKEAECLWLAERPSGNKPNGRISADWGCVGLLENPAHPIPDELHDVWTKRVLGESCYGQLMNSGCDEEVVVDKSGFLKIPWPKSEDSPDLGIDVLLATATNPTIVGGRYPSAQQIANAWNTPVGKGYVDYFCKNRAHGIKTFQDTEIEDRLRELWQ